MGKYGPLEIFEEKRQGYIVKIKMFFYNNFEYFGYGFLRDALLIKKSDYNGINPQPGFNNVLFIISINYINLGKFLTGIN